MSRSLHSAAVAEHQDSALRDPAVATNVLVVGVGGQGVILAASLGTTS